MKEFTVYAEINASPEELYLAWLDSDKHTSMTGSAAKVSNQIGAAFSAWDGYISGTNLELETGSRILQSWRTVEFKDDEPDSHIEILFESTETGSKIILRHWDLPAHGDQYESGWDESYFQPMQVYFK
jgi:activator of HSP90 ATPase